MSSNISTTTLELWTSWWRKGGGLVRWTSRWPKGGGLVQLDGEVNLPYVYVWPACEQALHACFDS
jgi:hypothetical protein